MENWIKNNLEKLEITPKSGNWEQISAGLDGEKKNKKRFVLVFLFLLAAAIFIFSVVWSSYSKPEMEFTKTDAKPQVDNNESKTVTVLGQEDTSRFLKQDLVNPSISSESEKVTYLAPRETASKSVGNRIDKNESGTMEVSKKEDINRESVRDSESLKLAHLESTETSFNGIETRLEREDRKWAHSLASKVPVLVYQVYPLVSPKLNLRAIALPSDNMDTSSLSSAAQSKKLKSWKSVLIPDRLYTEYQRGRYLNYPNSYLDITNNVTSNVDLGLGYTIRSKFEIEFGVGFYTGNVTSNVGDEIVLSQRDYALIGTSNPPDGFNSSMDTLTVFSNPLYNDLRDKDIYTKGQVSTITQTISGYRIPISFSYKIAAINSFSVKSRLGVTFNFVKDYSNLSYLDEFQVLVNEKKDNQDLRFNSFSIQGGLLAEYRPRNLGMFISASLAVNNSAKLTKSILTDSYQSSIGVGLSYYISTK